MVLRIVDSSLSFIPLPLCARRVSTMEDPFIVEAKPYANLPDVQRVVSHRDAFTVPMCERFGICRRAADR
jgi:hypothetical protein